MTIIKVEPIEGTNFHPYQSQSHREECWEEGHIEVPENLERKVMDCYGFCDLVIANGALVDVIPGEIPPKPKSEPTTEEILLELTADQEYRLCMIELGLK